MGNAFRIDQDDPDFGAIGLTKTCYINDERFYSLPETSFGKHRGVLTGQLLARFVDNARLKHLHP